MYYYNFIHPFVTSQYIAVHLHYIYLLLCLPVFPIGNMAVAYPLLCLCSWTIITAIIYLVAWLGYLGRLTHADVLTTPMQPLTIICGRDI